MPNGRQGYSPQQFSTSTQFGYEFSNHHLTGKDSSSFKSFGLRDRIRVQ